MSALVENSWDVILEKMSISRDIYHILWHILSKHLDIVYKPYHPALTVHRLIVRTAVRDHLPEKNPTETCSQCTLNECMQIGKTVCTMTVRSQLK